MQYNPSLELGSRMKWNQPMGSPKSMQNIGYEHKYE